MGRNRSVPGCTVEPSLKEGTSEFHLGQKEALEIRISSGPLGGLDSYTEIYRIRARSKKISSSIIWRALLAGIKDRN